MARSRLATLAGLVLGLCTAVTTVIAQPITFPTSMSVGEGDLILRAQPWYSRSTDDPAGLDRALTEWRVKLIGIYGVTRNATVFVVAPYLDRRWREGANSTDIRGFGDVELSLRRTVVEVNRPRRTFSVSPFAGVELPTGDDSARGFPADLALGSGAAGFFVGFALRDATHGKPHRFFASRYTFTTENEGFDRGDRFEANVAIKPGLASWHSPRRGLMGVNGMIELQYHWMGAHERGGRTVDGSGGSLVNLTPGIVFTSHRLILEAAVRFPVVQALNGQALKNDFGLLLGIWRNF